jgi:tRNA-splicing ligase RtcB
VGVDIGCGMCAVMTDLGHLTEDNLKTIMSKIREVIPLGMKHHSTPQDISLLGSVDDYTIAKQEYNSAKYQLGTLGGGNHFIEIQTDGKFIWFMIHSGSRNVGYKVAKYYNNLAQELCKKWYSNIPEFKGEDGLAFLPIDTEEGQNYLKEMKFCLDFAKANRDLMSERIQDIMVKFGAEFTEYINIHHNYASIENHFGKNVWVHRKGATSAYEGQLGIIPGSQGTKSYIVKGKGNILSFKSCSHGAGRRLSRKKAREELSLENEIKNLERKGIIHSIRTEKDLDEAANAYKDISVVMEEQKDLVDIVTELTPLAVIKG